MSVFSNFFNIKNTFITSVFLFSLLCSAMDSPSLIPDDFYNKLSDALKKIVTKDQIEGMIKELTASSKSAKLDNETLCTLIDDPKGDCMCQLWSLVPVVFGDQSNFVDKTFVNLLVLFSKCVDKNKMGKVEASFGGGITGVARSDISFLENYVKKTQSTMSGKKKKVIPKILFAAIRAALATRLYGMLSTYETTVPKSCVWRYGLQEKPTLAMPFTESYLLFLKIIKKKDVPIIVNYLQYRALKQDSDEASVKILSKKLCPVVLKKVNQCLPARAPEKGETCLMIDMYSAFYGDEDDATINNEFSSYIRKLNQFDDFADFVMQIAAAHAQFTDSKIKVDQSGCPMLEPDCLNDRYVNDLARVKITRIGITNLAKKDGKSMLAAIELVFDETRNEVNAINIPLNTLHVYAVPFDQIKAKQDYWRNWIDKSEGI